MGSQEAVNFNSRVAASTAAEANSRLPRSRIALMAPAGCHQIRNSSSMPLTHPLRPAEVARQFAPPPGETPELRARDLFGVQPPIGLDAPAQVRTAPRAEPVAARETPQDADHNLFVTYWSLIRLGVRRGVVAAARAHRGVARRLGGNADGAECAVHHRIHRRGFKC